MDRLLFWWGRRIGRRDVTVARSHGIASLQARRIVAERAAELRGARLRGFWQGVADGCPEWEISQTTPDDA